MGVQPKKSTFKGPADWFSGDVWIDPIVQSDDDSLNVGLVHFTPGARTAWHSHRGGQTLYIIDGVGRVQERGKDIVEVLPGDIHVTPEDKQHWHGATHDRFMSHLSISRGPATWRDHVDDDE